MTAPLPRSPHFPDRPWRTWAAATVCAMLSGTATAQESRETGRRQAQEPAAQRSAAQQGAAEREAPLVFDDVIQVRVVDVEVVVTDRRGNRVRGLGAEDFRLFVDGRPQTIDYFTEVVDGRATADADASADGLDPAFEPGEVVGNHLLLFVDDNHTPFTERKIALRGILDELGSLRPEDSLSVVVHTGTQLETLVAASNDPAAIGEAVERLMSPEFGGRFRSNRRGPRMEGLANARRNSVADVTRDGPVTDPTSIEQEFDTSGNDFTSFGTLRSIERRLDLEHSVTAVVSTMRAFRDIEGRKSLLLLNGDWPIGTFATGLGVDVITESDVVRPMLETANLLGWTIYPVGLSSVKTNLFRKGFLDQVAETTGGDLLDRRTQVLGDVLRDTSTYYSLGFVPTMRRDDARHDLVVEVLRPGLEVRARDSYIDLSQSAQLAMAAQTALLFGDASDESSGLRLVAGQAERWGFRKMDVPLEVYIPLDELTFVQQNGEDATTFDVRLAVMDESGIQAAEVPTIPVTLRGEQTSGDVYRLPLELHMRRRPHLLVVTVYDRFGDRSLTRRMRLSFRSTREGATEALVEELGDDSN